MTEERSPVNSKKRAALGRGLGALLGDSRNEQAVETDHRDKSGLTWVALSSVSAHPDNPRTHFDEESLDELARSIASRGMIQPVIVRPAADGRYQLVAGERRWRAAQKAQLHDIPAIVRDLDDRDVDALALIENLQREDLNPIEEARAYSRLSSRDGMTQADIAGMVDKSRSHVANLMRLLELPAKVLEMVETGDLGMGHARALINSPDAEEIAKEAAKKGLSVREVEKRVRRASDGGKTSSKTRTARSPSGAEDADIAAVRQQVEEFLGLPVAIAPDDDPRSGSVTVSYKSLDQLDLICQRLTGGEI